jgi:hypothetical protein
MNFTKQLLSGSTNGKQIKITQIATLGDTIHTAVSGTTDFDEVYLYAMNADTASVDLFVEWGEATVPDGRIELTLAPEDGYVLVTPGLLLQNSLVITAFAGKANVVMINGYVNRITA